MPEFDAQKHAAEILAHLQRRHKKRAARPLSICNPITLEGFNGRAVVIARLSRQLTLLEVDQHRFTNCDIYEKCLDYAEERRWHSFSCSKCPAFQAQQAKEASIAKSSSRGGR